MPEHIDVHDPGTWPNALVQLVDQRAAELDGSTDYAADLTLGFEEHEFCAATEGRGLRVYQCTRLMDFELDGIRNDGLRTLSGDLVAERIHRAEDQGEMSSELATAARAQNVFAISSTEGRLDRVCAGFGYGIFDEAHNGCHGFMKAWGGEAIDGGPIDPKRHNLTNGVGKPAIVVASVPVVDKDRFNIYPGLSNVLIGLRLGIERPSAEIHLTMPIPGKNVLDILQPGHPEYDRHPHLPNS